jgi:hypothetical protein
MSLRDSEIDSAILSYKSVNVENNIGAQSLKVLEGLS